MNEKDGASCLSNWERQTRPSPPANYPRTHTHNVKFIIKHSPFSAICFGSSFMERNTIKRCFILPRFFSSFTLPFWATCTFYLSLSVFQKKRKKLILIYAGRFWKLAKDKTPENVLKGKMAHGKRRGGWRKINVRRGHNQDLH